MISRRRLAIAALGLLALLCGVSGTAHTSEQRAFDLNLGDGDGDSLTVRVHQGDKVVLRLSARQPMTLHLLGYDRNITVTPGRAETLEFDAGIAGRFPISRHADAGKRHGGEHGRDGRDAEKRLRLGKSGPGSREHRALVYVEVHPR